MTKTLVVARWNEDLTWLHELPKDWKTYIVYKDVDIPNKGREASSYFYAMQKLSVAPTDTVAFVQGAPFAHCAHLWDHLAQDITEFTPLGDYLLECDEKGNPHHPDLPVGELYDKWVGGGRPTKFGFVPGGQFMLPGSHILRYSHDWYQNMFNEANKGAAPWVLERLWGYIFS